MTGKGYTFCYYVSGHGFGHATRVNQIITELLRSTSTSISAEYKSPLKPIESEETTPTSTTTNTPILTTHIRPIESNGSKNEALKETTAATATTTVTTTITKVESRHTIYIISDAPQFIFQDVISLGAIYRNAKVDAGVVQPLAYSVDRRKTIEGVKSFLAKRDEMIQHEVSWLTQVGANCVLTDAPFLPCAAASAYGIPACLITNFTFDEVYRFLREGDPFDKDIIAVADAALEDYKKASLLLRLPGSIDIPSFEDEILALEGKVPRKARDIIISNNANLENLPLSEQDISIKGLENIFPFEQSKKNPKLTVDTSIATSRPTGLQRRAIDVPMVVRKAINTREDVLRSLGVDEETIKTKKMVLVSFGGQRLKQGWGNPLPDGWIGVICGLPVSHELPDGFYRSPHGVYVPDLTHAADIVIGKLGYGTCSECIAHDTPLIYVSRPQFIEEHGLIKMMIKHGLPVEMTAEEFETGLWQRSIIEADRLFEEEKEAKRMSLLEVDDTHPLSAGNPIREFAEGVNGVEEGFHKSHESTSGHEHTDISEKRRSSSGLLHCRVSKAKSLAESVNMAEMARGGPISPIDDDDDPPLLSPAMSRRRSASIHSLSSATFRSRRLSSGGGIGSGSGVGDRRKSGIENWIAGQGSPTQIPQYQQAQSVRTWQDKKISHDGGRVCALLIEEYMSIWDKYHLYETKNQTLVLPVE